jgi:hypothetical protein
MERELGGRSRPRARRRPGRPGTAAREAKLGHWACMPAGRRDDGHARSLRACSKARTTGYVRGTTAPACGGWSGHQGRSPYPLATTTSSRALHGVATDTCCCTTPPTSMHAPTRRGRCGAQPFVYVRRTRGAGPRSAVGVRPARVCATRSLAPMLVARHRRARACGRLIRVPAASGRRRLAVRGKPHHAYANFVR